MGSHDAYGKRLLRAAAGNAFEQYGPAVCVDYGVGRGAQVDGVVAGSIVVEVESRVSKQIRGALLDLICHSCSKKLLVILPTAHVGNAASVAVQCRTILSRFAPCDEYRVVVTNGHGDDDHFERDVTVVQGALQELGFVPTA